MLPEGWKKRRLGDIFKFKNGLNGDSTLYGAGAKFVNVMDVFRGSRLRHHEIIGEMIATAKQLDEFGIKFGDVFFNRTSETDDEIAFAAVYLDDKAAVFGGFVIRARPIDQSLTPEFCTYAFQSAFIRRSMIRLGQGAIRSNIGQGDLTTVPIKFPPIAEQRRIAEILSTWDRAIAVQEQLVANARAQKKALMQTLLTGKKRLPGFKGDWQRLSFDEIFKVENDKKTQVQKTQYKAVGRTPIVDQGQDFIVGYTDQDEIYESIPAIVFGDHTRSIKWIDFPFCPGADGTQILKSTRHIHLQFSFYLLLSAEIPNLGYSRHMRELKALTFNVPSDRHEQEKLTELLAAAEDQNHKHENALTQLVAEKSALMQQLLTGKRRVKVETLDTKLENQIREATKMVGGVTE